MLRRHFLSSDDIQYNDNYIYTITYYAALHMPFCGGFYDKYKYHFISLRTETDSNDDAEVYRFTLIDDTYDSDTQTGVYTMSCEAPMLGTITMGNQKNFLNILGGCTGGFFTWIDTTSGTMDLTSDKLVLGVVFEGMLEDVNPSTACVIMPESIDIPSVTLPINLKRLRWNSFRGFHAIKNITIPSQVTEMWGDIFRLGDNTDFYHNTALETIRMEPITPPTTLGNPIIGIPITDFKIRVYADCVDTYKNDSVWGQYSEWYDTINDTIVYYIRGERYTYTEDSDILEIKEKSSYKSATKIYLPNSVTSIEKSAFRHCPSLTSITIGNSVRSIGDWAFSSCSSLSSITIPESITSIGESAFQACSSLRSITIPNSVTSIGDLAFHHCSSLTSMTIGNSVTSIGDWAFHSCSSLTSMTIGNSVTSIGDLAFGFCSSLTSIIIPNSVTSIGERAFLGCDSLTSITISNSVTSIGDEAFADCSGIKSMVVESGNTVYDSRENCNAIIETATNILIAGCKNTTIPNSVTSIGYGAFRGCSSLTSITIPNSVTYIGNNAFAGCSSLTSITIPNSVTRIGISAFSSCSSLNSITFEGTITQWKAVTKGTNWNDNVPATVVHCTDGDVTL